MSRPLDIGLDQIKTLLLKMGKLSQDAISTALDGFNRKEDVHVQTRAWSNTLLILSEEVEDVATEMIALHQPMAGDLRTLKAYIKIAYDMERYGRYAMDMSDILLRLGGWAEYDDGKLTIKEMGEKVLEIVATSIKLIDTMDENLVWELSKAEAEIDEFYLRNLSELINYEGEDHKTIIANLLTIRYLERIADHASYIAESITYAVTGKRLELR
jgi:phosphate transport system protein